jgi:regulator of RNase E activity RraA
VLDALSARDVPVFAVDPSTRAALWGELFACAAVARGAAGAIVDGFIRDTRQLRELAFPVFARGHSPLDTVGRAEVREFGVAATCGGVLVEPGDYVLADDDGVVLVPSANVAAVLALIERKGRDERGARSDLMAGASIFDVWQKWRVL